MITMDETQKIKERVKDLEEKFSGLLDYLEGLELKTKASFDDFQPNYDEDYEDNEDEKKSDSDKKGSNEDYESDII